MVSHSLCYVFMEETSSGWGVKGEKSCCLLVGLNEVGFLGRFRPFIASISQHYKMWELGRSVNWRRLINVSLDTYLQKLFLCLQ